MELDSTRYFKVIIKFQIKHYYYYYFIISKYYFGVIIVIIKNCCCYLLINLKVIIAIVDNFKWNLLIEILVNLIATNFVFYFDLISLFTAITNIIIIVVVAAITKLEVIM